MRYGIPFSHRHEISRYGKLPKTVSFIYSRIPDLSPVRSKLPHVSSHLQNKTTRQKANNHHQRPRQSQTPSAMGPPLPQNVEKRQLARDPPPQELDKRQAAREVIDILHEIATLLVCLD